MTKATSNPTWGYTRIRGGLKLLGIAVGRTTISRILVRNGVDPVPHRGMRWADFIKAHLGHIFAADFFTVGVLTAFGFVRYQVLFFIDIATRRVHVGGVVHEPDGLWTKQQVPRPDRSRRWLPTGRQVPDPRPRPGLLEGREGGPIDAA